MTCQPRTLLRFLVLLLPWPQPLLLAVHACEQCEIDAAESQAIQGYGFVVRVRVWLGLGCA